MDKFSVSLIDIATQKIVDQGFNPATARAIAGIAASVFIGDASTRKDEASTKVPDASSPAKTSEISVADELKLEWRDGYPPHPWDREWFIALTTYGERVVLKALPEEYTYDFKTADETFIKKERIAKWMQFPDSGYIAPVTTKPVSVSLEKCVRSIDNGADYEDNERIAKAVLTAAGVKYE